MNLLSALYADLHGDGTVSRCYDLVHSQEQQYGADGWVSKLTFDFDTPLVADGHMKLSVAGRFFPGFLEAERSVLMSMIDAVKGEHKLFTADYNYIALSEKRALFNAMRDIMFPCRNDQLHIGAAIEDCRCALIDVCQKASVWVGAKQGVTDEQDIAAVAEFHATCSELARVIEPVLAYSKRASDAIVMRNVPPVDQRQFDVTNPMPMVIDWEHSFVTLRTVYTAATKKLGGVLTNLTVLTMRDGQMKATIDASVQPRFFAGGLAPTKKAALAMLYYEVIKYVNVELGYNIIDCHHEICEFQKTYIARFDENMAGMEKCGKDLHQLMADVIPVFEDCVADMSAKLDINDHTEEIISAVHDCSVAIKCAMYNVRDNWNRLKG